MTRSPSAARSAIVVGNHYRRSRSIDVTTAGRQEDERMADTGGLPLGSTLLSPLEYMKKAWSSFNLPTQFAPTLDLAELDRRITDLKAVEQWLILNQNLLRNAIRHSGAQHVTVDWAHGCLLVDDDGAGFGAAAPSSSSPGPDEMQALGIGLTIVERICEACGWSLQIGPRPGGGTRVRVRLMPESA